MQCNLGMMQHANLELLQCCRDMAVVLVSISLWALVLFSMRCLWGSLVFLSAPLLTSSSLNLIGSLDINSSIYSSPDFTYKNNAAEAVNCSWWIWSYMCFWSACRCLLPGWPSRFDFESVSLVASFEDAILIEQERQYLTRVLLQSTIKPPWRKPWSHLICIKDSI